MSKYRFLPINGFSLQPDSLQPGGECRLRSFTGPRETQLYNCKDVTPFLEGIDWDLYTGAPSTHGNRPVQSMWEVMSVGYNRQPAVREACASGKCDASVLPGGGHPGILVDGGLMARSA